MAPENPDSKDSAGAPLLVALAALLVAGGFAFWWTSIRTPPAAPPAAPAPAPAPEAPAVAPPPVPQAELAGLLRMLSPNPEYRRWLAEPDPVHRWAVLADNLQEDVSPRAQLGFLRPARPFTAVQGKAGLTAAPEAQARYDAVADAIASVDAAGFVRVYRALHATLEWTYRDLGYPAAKLDTVAARALGRIAAAPSVAADAPPVLVKKGALYLYQDPQLEGLGPVEKHLLRMGPRNQRLVQEKARELRAALGLPEVMVAPR